MRYADIRTLDAELRSLASEERKGLVRFLRRLDVLDQEHAYAALNCGSAFDYLVRELHMCEGTAWGRVNAMRLVRRFPQLEAALEEGRLNPTQLKILGPILTPENVDELVRRATHLTKEKTKELAVSIKPKEVPADGLRKLPTPRASPVVPAEPVEVQAPRGPSPEMVLTLGAGPTLSLPPPEAAVCPQAPRPAERSRIEPVSAERWQWRIGLDKARKAKFDRLRDILSHKIPDGDPDKVFDQMLEDSLEKQGKQRGYVEPSRRREPAPLRPATPGQRAPVPLPVRREVLKRDGYRCTFVAEDGQRCPCTTRLEMDHLEPAKETGTSRVEDLTTRCRSHNQWRAVVRYGAGYVRRRIEEERRERRAS